MIMFVLTRKSLIVIGICFVATIMAGIIALNATTQTVETATEPREIPIYCVETDEKKVAISFDAAWGN